MLKPARVVAETYFPHGFNKDLYEMFLRIPLLIGVYPCLVGFSSKCCVNFVCRMLTWSCRSSDKKIAANKENFHLAGCLDACMETLLNFVS